MVYLCRARISNIYYMKRFFAPIIIRVTQAYTKLFPNILKKRTWWPIFLVSILLITGVGVGMVHAQSTIDFSLEGLLNGLVELIGRILIELSKLCIFLAIFFLRLFITLASYNNYIDVSVVKLGWVMVRDVANMFFIVGLLVIAFATILGLESYEWKKGVVKIVLMAILINFSNLIAQLIIDVAHIFTITFLNAVSATAGGNLITLFQLDNILKLTAGAPNEFGDTRQVASLTLFAGSALAFGFALLAALSIGAYLLVMIARIVVLWALIILSPLAFMLYALPQGEDYAKQWWSEFSKHVIVAPIMVFFLWLAFATFGTGQVINEIQSGENVIQINATGEAETVGKQSVSILEISTWENLASFLLGIAFLWVGIKKTEETGAMGSGLVGNAIDFTKNVATIATGYAAGRWIVGKGVEKGKEIGGAYGKLGLGRVGNIPVGKSGKVLSDFNFLKKGAVRRQVALDKLDKTTHDKEHRIYEQEYEKGKGFVGWLAPSSQRRAEEEVKAHDAARANKADYQGFVIQAEADLFAHEEHEVKKDKERELDALLKTRGVDAKTVDKLDKIQNQDERLEAKEKEMQLSSQEVAAIEDKVTKKHDLYRARTKEMRNVDADTKVKKQIDEAFRASDLAHLTRQRGDWEKAAKKGLNAAIDRKIAEEKSVLLEAAAKAYTKAAIDAKRKSIEGDVRKEAKDNNITDELVIKQNIENALANFNKEDKLKAFEDEERKKFDGLKSDEKNKMVRTQAVIMMTDVEKANALDQVLKDNPELSKFQAMAATKSEERKSKKYQSESDRLSFAMSDVLRGLEGKTMDQERNWEKSKISEEMKEFQNWSYPELMEEMKRNYKIIKSLVGKEKEGKLTDQETDVLKNARQRQATVVGSIHDQGMGGSFVHEFRSVAQEMNDDSFAAIDNDIEHTHEIIMGALSGRTYNELNTAQSFSEQQEIFRKGLKEKAGVLMRTLMKGIQNSAELKNNAHHNGLMTEGISAEGIKMVGFTNAMQANVGDDKIKLGTGTTDGGKETAQKIMEGFSLPTFDLGSASDGRAYVVTRDGKGIKFQHEAAKNALLSISRYSAQDIRRLGTPKLNYLSGGSYDQSSWDKDTKQFKMPDGEIRQTWEKVMTNLFHDSTNPSLAPATRDRALGTWREIYKQLGVQDADDMQESELIEIAQNSKLLK